MISLVVKNKVYNLDLFHLDTELISENNYRYVGTIVPILSRTGSSLERFKGSKTQENIFFLRNVGNLWRLILFALSFLLDQKLEYCSSPHSWGGGGGGAFETKENKKTRGNKWIQNFYKITKQK